MKHLYLASRSPRRRELLSRAGIDFQLLDVEVDETLVAPSTPEDAARELAERKARAGAGVLLASDARATGRVLGADTLVALGEKILGKPRDRDHARAMLAELAGTTHRVITGVCLFDLDSGAAVVRHDATAVTMRAMSAEEIAEYVASGEADDKAGSYAIQERGDRFVERIEGSWSNVVGLPMETLEVLLAEPGDE